MPERVSGPPPLDAARRSTWEPRGSFLLAGAALQALDGTRARFGAPLLMLPGAALGSLAAHLGASRLVSAGRGSISGFGRYPSAFRAPPPLMLPGAALGSLAARFCWQGQHFRLWTVPERFGAPLLMLPGAALGSLAARFCWQGHTHTRHTHVDSLTHTRHTHTRSLTVPFAHGARAGASLDTHTVDAHTFVHGARAGRCPSAFRGPPP